MHEAYDAEDIRGLTRSEHLLLWGFRVIAHGRGACPNLSRAFADQCGDNADEALTAFKALVLWVGHRGKRRLKLHAPGCIRATADELALVAMLAAAQASLHDGDEDRLNAHLAWLMAGPANEALALAAQTVAAALAYNGCTLPLRAADAEARTWTSRPELRVVH